jgi:hypothetical protein
VQCVIIQKRVLDANNKTFIFLIFNFFFISLAVTSRLLLLIF